MSWAAAAARGAAPPEPAPSSLVGPDETVAVLDANALIAAGGIARYAALADRLVTIKEVLAEVRDAASRAALASATAAGAAAIGVLEPSAASLAEVTRFARETGELHSLSAVDLKVLALAHTLEVAAHGREAHLRAAPAPPRLHSKAAVVAAGGRAALPGWGAAGGDWAELDALAEAEEAAAAAALAKAGVGEAEAGEAKGEAAAPAPPSSSGRGGSEDDDDDDTDTDGSWEVAAPSNAAARRRRRAASRRAARAEQAAAAAAAGEDGAAAAAATVVDADDPPATPGGRPDAPPPSRVACVTGDFAMQNVALQLGLRLVAPDGRAVEAARRWALRCSACGATSREAGRLFCPGCGHASLDKVEVLAGPDGAAVYGVRKRHTLRGTRFPLPAPKGGKEGRAANPVLAEDAMPGFGRRGGPGGGKARRATKQAGHHDDDAAVGDADAWFARSGVAPAPAAAGGPGGGGAGAVRKLRGAAAPLAGWRINPNERVHQRTNRRG